MNAPFYRFDDSWKELEKLLDRAERKGLGALTSRELKRLCLLYRAVASQLARERAFGGSAAYRTFLNNLAARGHALLYAPQGKGDSMRRLLMAPSVLPRVVRRTARYHALAFLFFALGLLYGYFGAAADPDWAINFIRAEDERTPFAEREDLLKSLRQGREESGEWSVGVKSQFAAFLWKHNTQVALLVFFGGLLGGVPTVLLLFYNGTLLGVYSATFHRFGLGYEWWAWILPHGVTEIGAVILLGGGGLLLGKTILLGEGASTRREALERIRGTLFYILFAAFPLFLVAALTESFVRQSRLGDAERYVFAAAAAVVWALYFGLTGRGEEGTERLPRKTEAELFVSLPRDEELLEALGIARSRYTSPRRRISR